MLELHEDESCAYRLGFAGDTLNFSWYCRALLGNDWAVDYTTVIGEDSYSNRMLDFFNKNGIGTRHIRRSPDRRPGLYMIEQQGGDRQFTYWRSQSAARLLGDSPEFLDAALYNATLVYFSGITLAILPASGRLNLLRAIKSARNRGSAIAFDPNERPALWESPSTMREVIKQACLECDMVFPTFPDGVMHFGDANVFDTARRYVSWGVGEVVVKDGGNPALISVGDYMSSSPAISNVRVVDATGAGDSFNGAYVAARLLGADPNEAARNAHVIASRVVGQKGALISMDDIATQPH